MTLTEIKAPIASAVLAGLRVLLQDAVDGGASIGFHPVLDAASADIYWAGVAADLAAGSVRLLVVQDPAGTLAGSVQLALAQKPNGRLRAEVQKLLVHSGARRRGIGAQLLNAAEALALRLGRSLLVLDTRRGDAGERLYHRAGWQKVGVIPRYTLEGDGSRADTVIFFKDLAPAAASPTAGGVDTATDFMAPV
jgi:acetyltransferase